MYKKLLLSMLLFLLVSFPVVSHAAETLSMNDSGGYYKSGPYYDAERDGIRYEFNSQDLKKSKIEYFHDAAFSQAGTVREAEVSNPDSWYQWTTFNCTGFYKQTFYDMSGNVLITFTLEVAEGDLVSPTCLSGSGKDDIQTGDGDGGGGKCEICELLACPGWGDFMGKLDDIKAAIPPPPNWTDVAETFRETMIGSTPTPVLPATPQTPNAPQPPPPLEPLDNQGIQAPTGNEAPGLDDSSFTADDLKSEAPVIEEREDPTGGFDITNPIDALPSQDDFKKNVPNEGVADIPGNPRELENIAPSPAEQPNPAPSPAEQPNTAPMPAEQPNTVPMPGEDFNSAPIPSADTSTVPIPKNDGSTAPMPGE